MLALGAGFGEEALFRGWAQPAATAALASLPALVLRPDAATALGVAATSLVFGALHALTPAYFIWAYCASILFGLEALNVGLPAAMLTHTVYDLVALAVVLQQWGQPVWLRSGAGACGGAGASDDDAPA